MIDVVLGTSRMSRRSSQQPPIINRSRKATIIILFSYRQPHQYCVDTGIHACPTIRALTKHTGAVYTNRQSSHLDYETPTADILWIGLL
jgi:hypothetical protein